MGTAQPVPKFRGKSSRKWDILLPSSLIPGKRLAMAMERTWMRGGMNMGNFGADIFKIIFNGPGDFSFEAFSPRNFIFQFG